MKLIIYPDVDIWEFVLSGLKGRSDVVLYPLNRNSRFIQKAIRKYSNSSHLPSFFVLGGAIRKAISKLKTGDSLVLAEYTDLSLVYAIAGIIPEGVSRYVWLWNHKGDNRKFKKSLSVIAKNRFQVITYDESDTERYGLRLNTQFFNIKPYYKISPKKSDFSFDFLFVGYAKNRLEEIDAVRSLLSSYSCNFITVRRKSEYIPYSKYMEMAMQSRCIVEIVRKGDLACTLRPLEAIAVRRKLFTNNPAVRGYSFYNPQNIFILGEDDISKLSDFLHSPYMPLPDDVVESYDVNSWIDIFQ